MYWQEGHINNALYEVNSHFHVVRFDKVSKAQLKIYLATIAQYAKEIAKYAEDWKEDIELTEESN